MPKPAHTTSDHIGVSSWRAALSRTNLDSTNTVDRQNTYPIPMNACSSGVTGSHARPVPHRATAMEKEIHTWAFQALVSRVIWGMELGVMRVPRLLNMGA